ncbi:ATP-dependent DNA helicase DDX11 [Temnothorax curvispinosus]|uniref:DNA 5'-3' helicase n=1 Tax=Temnothorax curvispinosus TaxID=300111 RepID=A0A6J1QIR5_9HYME|nr:ATP-dependent DNA helicase DDX11 [Temnothorax curvispinosus]XP_024882290.1 ATP-dependent DNA helicase DDX11 [Temnothorax curvispinosus]
MEPPQEFPFPFPAYEIQKRFMRELYGCLESGKLGLFESPTGTGKSLSLICSSLRWLVDHEGRRKQELTSTIAEIDSKIKSCEKPSDNWFTVQTEQIELNAKKQPLQAKLNALLEHEGEREKLKKMVESKKAARTKTTGKIRQQPTKKALESDKTEEANSDICDVEKDLILEDGLSNSESSEEEDTNEPLFQNTKIFFCSRTHSQLTQFVHELKRSPYSQDVSVVPVSSRQNYCINKNVKRLKHINLINEACLQLQRKKTTVKKEKDLKRSKVASGCPFIPGDQKLLMAEVLTNIQDVEEITQRGQESNTCPYYGSRKSLQNGQLILVPYNSILHKNTRTSLGIDLKGNVLIIDEAHNLLDAIEGMHSSVITGRNLLHCYSQLSQYQKRFESLFSARSVMYLGQLSFCLKKLLTLFGATTKSHPGDEINKTITPRLYKIEEFEVLTEIDTVNVFKLLEFVKASKLIHKLQGFVEQYGNSIKINEQRIKKSGVTEFLNSIKSNDVPSQETVSVTDAPSNNEEQTSNPLMAILSFLECLKSSCADGRICVLPSTTVGQGIIKFLLLNPAAHFHDIVRDARSVVLAGGTMEPMSEFIDQLFLMAGATPDRIMTFSCDHVIPKGNIISNVVMRGPTGVEFEFNFHNRQDTRLLDELGRALLNLCNVVPAGIVVFFPSYNYEDTVFKHLDKSGIISKISAKKRIYREPKLASQVNVILDQYAHSIKNPQSPCNGALLFSVVGGKLSEGLNFSDDLGRCVIVVGLPYPNIKSPELQEKMKYLNEHVKPDAGSSFYENSCMKAVNQCIGRSVRHINDYSTVVLLDKRYCHKVKVLPQWIQRSVTINDSFGSVVGNIAKFFAAKRIKKT